MLHHVNVPSHDLRAAARFYSTVFDMIEKPFPFVTVGRGKMVTRNTHVGFFEDGLRHIHLNKPQGSLAADNEFHINPVLRGHVALNVLSLDPIKERLRRLGQYFVDAGAWGLKGYFQIYCYDPSMNVIEINQRHDLDPSPPPFPDIRESATGRAPERRGEGAAEPWSLRQVTLPAMSVQESARFFEEVVGMRPAAEYPFRAAGRGRFPASKDDFAWFSDGSSELILVRPTSNLAADNALFLDPNVYGHFGIEVPNLETVVARLREQDLYFQETGAWEREDRRSLYCYDPNLNVVEVYQSRRLEP